MPRRNAVVVSWLLTLSFGCQSPSPVAPAAKTSVSATAQPATPSAQRRRAEQLAMVTSLWPDAAVSSVGQTRSAPDAAKAIELSWGDQSLLLAESGGAACEPRDKDPAYIALFSGSHVVALDAEQGRFVWLDGTGCRMSWSFMRVPHAPIAQRIYGTIVQTEHKRPGPIIHYANWDMVPSLPGKQTLALTFGPDGSIWGEVLTGDEFEFGGLVTRPCSDVMHNVEITRHSDGSVWVKTMSHCTERPSETHEVRWDGLQTTQVGPDAVSPSYGLYTQHHHIGGSQPTEQSKTQATSTYSRLGSVVLEHRDVSYNQHNLHKRSATCDLLVKTTFTRDEWLLSGVDVGADIHASQRIGYAGCPDLQAPSSELTPQPVLAPQQPRFRYKIVPDVSVERLPTVCRDEAIAFHLITRPQLIKLLGYVPLGTYWVDEHPIVGGPELVRYARAEVSAGESIDFDPPHAATTAAICAGPAEGRDVYLLQDEAQSANMTLSFVAAPSSRSDGPQP